MARGWTRWTVGAVAVIAALFAMPWSGARFAALLVAGGCSLAAIVVGVRRHRPACAPAWWLLGGCVVAGFAGDVVWRTHAWLGGAAAGHAVAVVRAAAYVTGLAGFALLTRARQSGRTREALIDTAVLTLAVGMVVWELAARDSANLTLLVDVAAVWVVARLAMTPRSNVRSLWLLVAAVVARVVSDVAVAILWPDGRYHAGTLLDAGWLTGYLMIGAASLHPSMAALGSCLRAPDGVADRSGLAVVCLATVVGPTIVVQQEAMGRQPHIVIAAGTVAVVLLVLGRLWLLLDDRERTRTALRLSEARFRSLVQHASDAICVLDAGGVITYASPAISRLLGYQPRDCVGREAHDFVHPDDQPILETALTDAVSEPGTPHALELRVRHRNDSWRSAEVLLTARLDDPGVAGLILNLRDVTERKAFERRLAHAAHHDELTGLPNRLLLLERLEATLARVDRGAPPAALFFMDLDRFKLVNDTLGHDIGDQLLVAAADRLRQVVRRGDLVARFGGDEFVVLCEDVGDEIAATQLAAKAAAALDNPFALDGTEAFVSASVGIAISKPGDRPEALIRDADTAMYQAKERGRARTELFDETMRTETIGRLATASALRHAVDRRQLHLVYQPVVSVCGGDIVAVEALLRWHHPQRGPLEPTEFVGLAEETGLIVPIGRWVLQEACRQAARWQATPGVRPVPISVNISARQLAQPELVESVAAIVQRSGADPAGICLEITETVVMEDVDLSIAKLRALKEVGLRVHVDDFGTGYSSLSYLKRLPVDALKVDRSFVDGLGTDPDDSTIVQAVIGLAHALGLAVVGEGVETPEQLDLLRRMGCDMAQGYLFSRPVPASEVTELLRTEPARAGLPSLRQEV